MDVLHGGPPGYGVIKKGEKGEFLAKKGELENCDLDNVYSVAQNVLFQIIFFWLQGWFEVWTLADRNKPVMNGNTHQCWINDCYI